MRACLVAFFLIVAFAGCRKSQSDPRITRFCAEVEHALELGRDAFREGHDVVVPFGTIDANLGVVLHREATFCAGFHTGNWEDLQVKFGIAAQRLSRLFIENPGRSDRDWREQVAQVLDEMAGIMKEINSLPLRE